MSRRPSAALAALPAAFIAAASFTLPPTAPLAAQSLRVAERLEVLEERAQKDSLDPAAHYNMAMGYLSKKRWDEADAALKRAVAIDAQFADAWLALSIARDRDDRFWNDRRKAGRDSLVKAVEERTGYYRRAFLCDPMVDIRILGSVMWVRPWGEFASGLKDLTEGRYDAAWKNFDATVNRWFKDTPLDKLPEGLVWFRALAGTRSANPDVAVSDYESLIRRIATTPADSVREEAPLQANEYRFVLAALHHKAGRLDQAIALYREVAENDAGNYMAHVRLAAIHEGLRDYPTAVRERGYAVNINPDDASLLLDLGITLGKAGNMAEAEERLQQALQLNPRDVRPLFWLGIATQAQGKKEASREAFSRFVTLAPSRYERQVTAARERLNQLQ
jgi:tetratricopeptide (TPR) repeat protein